MAVPLVDGRERARRKDGAWRRKRRDAGRRKARRKIGILRRLIGFI